MSEQKQVDEFCRSVGELVLWTSIIDERLTDAVCLIMLQDASPMAHALVGELEFRRKAEVLKTRAKTIPRGNDWRKALLEWVNSAERVNGHRNTAAHHQLRFDGRKFLLASHQATRIIKDLEREPVELSHLHSWVELAKGCVEESDIVLSNLKTFASEWRKKGAVRVYS